MRTSRILDVLIAFLRRFLIYFFKKEFLSHLKQLRISLVSPATQLPYE
jgi:hypothetical protein